MGLKEKETDLELIRELVRHPGYEVIKEKVTTIYKNCQTKVTLASVNEFAEQKGRFLMAKIFYHMFVEEPQELARSQAVSKLKRR